jgi:hypothetical protein
MSKRMIVLVGVALVVLTFSSGIRGQNQPWNNSGLAQSRNEPQSAPSAPAPRRDLSGIWDAGGAGIGARGANPAPLTPWGEALGKTHKAGDGIRMAPIAEINDPLSTMGDPEGFPRNLLFELRPFQIVQTPNQVLILYMFEKRWRVVWTDGRQLPKDPDPRWYGYSVGKWEDDTTFVVQSNGTDERTWLDNAGNPHSNEMRVEERYHRVNMNTMELTVTIDDPKAYTKPWVARNKLALRLMPPDTDLMEMIPSASEAFEYKKVFAK